ncbi:DUF3094 family protein [Endozoicomonas lisbonensis]|uniref:DUF3094 domain-containing protein n=1 Tax=Endozoicomonas lisbonensis TaxID=3120522 RepID=A0ABV2SF03_9GAMM
MMDRTQTRLKPEDQAKVDAFLKQGINATERSRFKPFKLMLWLAAIIVALGLLSRAIGVFILG